MKTFILVVAFSIVGISFAQKTRTIGFYNAENLFDTIDGTNDDAEFLPAGKNHWDSPKYLEKIKHVNQVFSEMQAPLIIGMCEIENAAVVRDVLKHSTTMKKYGVVHVESPDARGIDVALIYDSAALKLVKSGNIRFILPGQSAPSTRDIVWAKFAQKKDTIVAMVNHWPSRRSGDESVAARLEAARNARLLIDSLLNVNLNYKIVFMGDLNDYPSDKAPQLIGEKLTPMILPASGKFGGTHNYKGEWNVMDHIFVSNGFLTAKKGFCVPKDAGKIYSPDFLLQEYKGQLVPFRTYGGSNYLGGYSDHLPVSIVLNVR
jgi:predicted extracellular nuclease